MSHTRFAGFTSVLALAMLLACQSSKKENPDNFQYKVDQFADLQILRYQVPGFEDLSLQQKKLVYYLYEAALSGRDIIYDQNNKNNLTLRRTLEAIINHLGPQANDSLYGEVLTYAKRFWVANGMHHHYAMNKLPLRVPKSYFLSLLDSVPAETLPIPEGKSMGYFKMKLELLLFDSSLQAKRVVLDSDKDVIRASAMNYYEGVTQQEAEDFYLAMMDTTDQHPISYGLNSKLMVVNGELAEQVYKVGGMYTEALERVVYWLEKAITVAENEAQRRAMELLVDYYKTGDLRTFDEYNMAWVQDTASVVDVINGFIEVYGDPLGRKAAWESVVSIRDPEASQRMQVLSAHAAWFEANSPIMDTHKRKEIRGISYKVINVVVEGGDAAPSTPIGINLPNSNWIRQEYGSKSVSLGNIINAYNAASSGGTVEEFYLEKEAQERSKTHSILAANLHTALHEVIGHASGQLEPGVKSPDATLKNYASALEEARADLVALYFIMDPKLVELGVMPGLEVAQAEYDSYMMNGLMLQLKRLEPGHSVEEAHMRNRQMIAQWAYEQGRADQVVEKVVKEGKTYFVVRDYDKLRKLFGDLLREVQRIKSQGDFAAGQALIENYGVKVDTALHQEVLRRFAQLNKASYSGFIQPKLVAEEKDGEIVDVKIEYPTDFVQQMLEYGEKYSFLPHQN
ncbi:MAG: dihydrofolate reductase [Cytophagales bacterium]|nr:dihydrofolate reductase [Cytophagales bacterium]